MRFSTARSLINGVSQTTYVYTVYYCMFSDLPAINIVYAICAVGIYGSGQPYPLRVSRTYLIAFPIRKGNVRIACSTRSTALCILPRLSAGICRHVWPTRSHESSLEIGARCILLPTTWYTNLLTCSTICHLPPQMHPQAPHTSPACSPQLLA
jgi:hypothetical protein